MYHKNNGSGFAKSEGNFLLVLFNCSIIICIATANPSPRAGGSNGGDELGRSLAGLPSTKRQSFRQLATELDYFSDEWNSNEEVPKVTEIMGKTKKNNTVQENRGNFTRGCPPCQTEEVLTSSTAASEPLDVVAELEKLMWKICPQLELRESLEQGARKERGKFLRLEDYCAVKLVYGYDGEVDKYLWYERKDAVTVTAELQNSRVIRNKFVYRGADQPRTYAEIRSERQRRPPRSASSALQYFQTKISNGLN